MPKPPDVVDSCRIAPTLVDVTSEDVRRLYFRTTSAATFVPKDLAFARTENFVDVHAIGQKSGKYMNYQKKRAPLLDRTSCKYYAEFTPLPLGDNKINTELAQTFKDRSGANKAMTEAKFAAASNYTEAFRPPTRDQAKFARPKSAKPKVGRGTTLPQGALLETKSFSHNVYRQPVALAPSVKAVPPRPNLALDSEWATKLTTSYQSQFVNPNHLPTAPHTSAAPAAEESAQRLWPRPFSAPTGRTRSKVSSSIATTMSKLDVGSQVRVACK